MSIVLRVVGAVVGSSLVAATLFNAVKTFVLPRAAPSRLIAVVFHGVQRVLRLRARPTHAFAERDRIMALHAPIALILIPVAWVTAIVAGYTVLFRVAGQASWRGAATASGSSVTTLGFAPLTGFSQTVLAVSEAVIGLGLVALVIAYLPTMYGAFQRREAAVALLETRAGSPPAAVEMLARYQLIGWLEELDEVWQAWEVWFADVEESHTSLAPLVFFRSPFPDRGWVTAAGTVLDAASLRAAAVDLPRSPRAELCIRAGYVSLRRIADLFAIAYDPDPLPTDPISITREEFDAALDELAEAGVPLVTDRQQAWRDFAGWRVNYDTVLLALSALTMAPAARWTSDRGGAPRLRGWRVGAFRPGASAPPTRRP